MPLTWLMLLNEWCTTTAPQFFFPPDALDKNDLKRQFIKHSTMNSASCFCSGQHSPWTGTGTTPQKPVTADKSNITALSEPFPAILQCVLWLWRSVLYLETVHRWKLLDCPIKVDERWKCQQLLFWSLCINLKNTFAFLIRIQLPSQPTSELAVKCNASSPQCKSKLSLENIVP